jgi:ABC-type phosphate transport system substrate-binding protein
VRSLKSLSLLAAGVMVAAGTALASPALADPINSHNKPVVPRSYDIVGVGADTDDTLFDQLAWDYDTTHKTHNKTHPYIYSFDATPPNHPLQTTSLVKTKAGCVKVQRPDGTGAGISQFELPAKTSGHNCIDFARASSLRPSTDPLNLGAGGDIYVALAEDAEVYAVNKGGNAPANLTTADLQAIYGCKATKWGQIPGTSSSIANQPIVALLPPTTAGVTKFWLQKLGLSTSPASCLVGTGAGKTPVLQQNQGISSQFFIKKNGKTVPNPNVIVPISVGKYIAQAYHSAAYGKKPTKKQNKFGHNDVGHLVLGSINGVAATVGKSTSTKINTKLNETSHGIDFLRPIYDVLWYATSSKNNDHIASNLESFFASAHAKVKGWFCSSKAAKAAIVDYGFLTVPTCGFGS